MMNMWLSLTHKSSSAKGASGNDIDVDAAIKFRGFHALMDCLVDPP